MNPSPQKSVYQLLGLFLTISITLIPCFLCSSPHYANCSQPFRCGNSSVLGDLRYPFWGINRGSYCGKPGFELKCVDNNPIITVSSHDLQLVGTDPQDHAITVASATFWNSLCPPEMFNDKFTSPSITELNSPPFNLGNSIRFLTILYGCPLDLGSQLSWSGEYSCSVNNTNVDVHFATHTVNPSLASRCLSVVALPILQESARALEGGFITLPEALNKGFELDYFGVGNSQCNTCERSGGQCGTNLTVDGFTCYCPDMPYTDECPYSKREEEEEALRAPQEGPITRARARSIANAVNSIIQLVDTSEGTREPHPENAFSLQRLQQNTEIAFRVRLLSTIG